jgi:dienelactone hydrolase
MLLINSIKAQNQKTEKPPLRLDSYKDWPEVSQLGLSDDGKYAYYSINNQPVGKTTWIVKATEKEQETKFISNWSNVIFSDDSRQLYAQLQQDTLLTLNLNNRTITRITNVRSYKLFMVAKTQWIAITSPDSKLTFKTLKGDNSYSINDVVNFIICAQGTAALIQTFFKKNFQVQWLNIETGKTTIIYEGIKAQNLIFDNASKQAAFTVNRDQSNEIWYYANGTEKAVLLADQHTLGIKDSVSIRANYGWGFSWDNAQLFFDLQRTERQAPKTDLTVWSYKDNFLPTDLDGRKSASRSFNAINILTKKIVRLVYDKQYIIEFNNRIDKYFLIRSFTGEGSEMDGKNNTYLCDINTGTQIPIAVNTEQPLNPISLSPQNKYVVYFDHSHLQYNAYSIVDGKTKIILKDSSDNLMRQKRTQDLGNIPAGICGWLPEDKAVLINETYDIIQVDPDGIKKPVELTEHEGTKNHVVFYNSKGKVENSFFQNGNIFLQAINLDTKKLGFYNYKVGMPFNIKDIQFGENYIPNLELAYWPIADNSMIKSKKNDCYLMKSEKCNQAPNIFYSPNLRDFKMISDIKPEKAFNWITSELQNYADSLGNKYQGILYKPENFDPSKTYPVILNYYITKSNELNRYLAPENGAGDINTNYLVSNGYLVFKIDIYGEYEKLGDGIMLSVNAAADHLTKFKWVNPKKIAVSGHSFGAYETNYIVTHSNRFAAAVSAAGVSDLVSSSNDISDLTGYTRQDFIRLTAYKVGKTLDEDPDLYIKNSPIFYAKDVTSPVLIAHNPEDKSVRFSQGRSFFIQLRTLKKPVWLLSYKGAGHTISNSENAVDYYTHLKQFLDHYLMDMPEPDWMK